jgi:hypothetical protein
MAVLLILRLPVSGLVVQALVVIKALDTARAVIVREKRIIILRNLDQSISGTPNRHPT